MLSSHYAGILAGYAAASIFMSGVLLSFRPIFGAEQIRFARPWLEIGLVVCAALVTIGIGQAYLQDWLIPETSLVAQTANQTLIFAPLLVLLTIRAPGARGAGLPLTRAALGLVPGILTAVGALWIYAMLRDFEPSSVFSSVFRVDNVPHAAQVLFEDMLIAALLLRVRASVGFVGAIAIVATLFAAGHVPALLANGADIYGLAALFLDIGIGGLVLGVVLASRSIWWFWPLHTAMDLTQFVGGPGGGS